jgi:hypothetical protein
MSLIDFGLGIAGMPEQEIADVKAGLPVLSSILDEAKGLEPIIEKARPHIEAIIPHAQALMPMIVEAMPTIQKMWPQIVAVTPLLQEMIAFAKTKA